MMDILTKKCSRCDCDKNRECFSKQKGSKDGLRSACKDCISLYSKKYHIENRETICQKVKKYTETHKEEIAEYKKAYREQNAEVIRAKGQEFYLENRDQIQSKNKEYYQNNKDKIKRSVSLYSSNKIKNDPKFKLDQRLSTAVYQHLKRFNLTKRQVGWQKAVGYTVEDLIKHLEKQFKPEMSWENYGSYWHVDHIIPKSWFDYESIHSPEFKRCWSLENLQPLEASKNMSKNSHFSGSCRESSSQTVRPRKG